MSRKDDGRWADALPGESDFAASVGPLPNEAGAGQCPPPDLVLAAQFEAVPEKVRTLVQGHIARCPACAALARDRNDEESTAPTAEERLSIQQRVFGPTQAAKKATADTEPERAERRRWAWWLLPVPVAAAAVLIIYVANRDDAGRTALKASNVQAPGDLAAAATLTKPPLQVPAALLLPSRGEGTGDPEGSPLIRALAAYRDGDFAAAAKLLAPLAEQKPEQFEIQFYLGVSLLFLERNSEAVKPLLAAKRSAAVPRAREAGWYLALAQYRRGDRALAAVEWNALCAQPGPFQTEACAALGNQTSPPAR